MSIKEPADYIKEKISEFQACMKDITSVYMKHTLLNDATDFNTDNIVLNSAKSFSDYMFERYSIVCKSMSKFEQDTKQTQVELCSNLFTSLQSFESEMNTQKTKMASIFKTSEDEFIKKMNVLSNTFENDIQDHNDYCDVKYNEFIDTFSSFQNGYSSILKPLNKAFQSLRMNKKMPMFVFDNNKQYPVDCELISRYPGTYYYKLLKDEQLRNEDGDIYIDYDDTNYEIIMKYLKGDIISYENMSCIEKEKLSDDMTYFCIPFRSDLLELRCTKEEGEKLYAWNHNRVILCNDKQYDLLNETLRKNKEIDTIYNSFSLDMITYNKENNMFSVHSDLDYGDVINEYLKNNNTLDLNKIKERKIKYNKLSGEFAYCGIPLDDMTRNLLKKNLFTFEDTTIIGNDYDEYINKWLGSQIYKLLYKGSRDGYTMSSFHKCCDNKGPTIMFIKSKDGWIFGRYTNTNWNTNNMNGSGTTSFLFTLKNAYKTVPQKYEKINSNNSYNGFGYNSQNSSNSGIFLFDNCNTNNESYICNDSNGFVDDSKYHGSIFAFTGSKNNKYYFQVSDCEVYSVCTPETTS